MGGATALAGLGGYAITIVAARGLGHEYSLFALFWSALYLAVGALAGVQQEITRATRTRERLEIAPTTANVVVFAAIASLVAAALVVATSWLWAPRVFGADPVALVVPLAVGAGLFVLVTAAAGTMYGTHSWRMLAIFTVLDVAFRLVLVLLGLLAGVGVVGLAWAAVVPFLLTVLVVVVPTRRALFSRSLLQVGYRDATLNVLRTVAAAASTAVLVSGFPLLIGLTTADETPTLLSAVVFALILTRAPIVVATLSLQSYLLVQFRDHPGRTSRLLVVLVAAVGAAGAVLALVAWWIGAEVIVLLAGEVFRLPAAYVGLLVASSVTTAWIMLTGTAVLSRGAHTAYSAGWLLAAITAILLMLIPGDIFTRSLVALAAAPLAGLALHLVALVRSHKARLEF